MASAQDWYARRLGQQPQQRAYQPQPQQYNPYQPPAQVPQFQPTPWQPEVNPPKGSVNAWNLVEMMGRWRGGQAHRTDKHPCPECGSSRFFSRVNSGTMMPPAPHCFDCGFNGRYHQGDPSTWGAA